MQGFQQNCAGITFRATCNEDGSAIDISTASIKQIVFTDPNGTRTAKTASFGDDTGQLEYTSASGDFDTVGIWQWQPYVYFSASEFWYGDSVMFKVRSNP